MVEIVKKTHRPPGWQPEYPSKLPVVHFNSPNPSASLEFYGWDTAWFVPHLQQNRGHHQRTNESKYCAWYSMRGCHLFVGIHTEANAQIKCNVTEHWVLGAELVEQRTMVLAGLTGQVPSHHYLLGDWILAKHRRPAKHRVDVGQVGDSIIYEQIVTDILVGEKIHMNVWLNYFNQWWNEQVERTMKLNQPNA